MLGLLVGAAVATKMAGVISEAAKSHMQGMIFMNSDSESFSGRNYLDTIHILQGLGFTNINVSEIRKHKYGLFTKNLYGKVESVAINGKTEFQKGSMFPQGAYVLVSFHVYKDSPRVEIPELNRRAGVPVQQYGGYAQPVNVQVNIRNEQPNAGLPVRNGYYGEQPTSNGYPCDYCGAIIPNKRGFCPRCGGQLGR